MSLLICIPLKEGGEYLDRFQVCKETWLPTEDVYGFLDSDAGLDSTDQKVRQLRMKHICQYALDNNYTHLFRVDSDAYVWVNRLLHSGFERHDYMGYCFDYSPRWAHKRTAHGGSGFTLSRKAMEVILQTPCKSWMDGNYWGDIWTGVSLFDSGIRCKRDNRFLDGKGTTITSDILPANHQFISAHEVLPENMKAIHALGTVSDLTIEPAMPLFGPPY
jgi:hypothetical protein